MVLPEPNLLVLPKGAERLAVIEAREFERLCAELERAKAALDALHAAGATVPGEIVHAILEGANPISVWRKRRGLTQTALAEASGVSRSHIANLESGRKDIRGAAVGALEAIADALDCEIGDLLPPVPEA